MKIMFRKLNRTLKNKVSTWKNEYEFIQIIINGFPMCQILIHCKTAICHVFLVKIYRYHKYSVIRIWLSKKWILRTPKKREKGRGGERERERVNNQVGVETSDPTLYTHTLSDIHREYMKWKVMLWTSYEKYMPGSSNFDLKATILQPHLCHPSNKHSPKKRVYGSQSKYTIHRRRYR